MQLHRVAIAALFLSFFSARAFAPPIPIRIPVPRVSVPSSVGSVLEGASLSGSATAGRIFGSSASRLRLGIPSYDPLRSMSLSESLALGQQTGSLAVERLLRGGGLYDASTLEEQLRILERRPSLGERYRTFGGYFPPEDPWSRFQNDELLLALMTSGQVEEYLRLRNSGHLSESTLRRLRLEEPVLYAALLGDQIRRQRLGLDRSPAPERPSRVVLPQTDPDVLAENAKRRELDLDAKLASYISRRTGAAVISIPERDVDTPGKLDVLLSSSQGTSQQEVPVPRWEFLGLERRAVAARFERLLADVDAGEPVLFLRGQPRSSTHALLPHRLTARTFDNSPRFADTHIENINHLANATLTPDRTVLFNLVPESPEALESMGLKGNAGRWATARKKYDELASKKGLRQTAGTDRETILETLRKGDVDTIVIVAHGKSDAIYLPDGSMITVSDILDLPPIDSVRKPVVILVACDAGRMKKGLTSIAQALLYRGRASAVVAPTARIPALGSTLRFLDRIINPEPTPARDAFRLLGEPWQLYVEYRVQGRDRSS